MNNEEKKEKLCQIKKNINNACDSIGSSLTKIECEAKNISKLADVAKEAPAIIDDINDQFKKATRLDGKDLVFLFIAIGLQCVRQYVLGKITQRKSDKESAESSHKVQDKIKDKLDGKVADNTYQDMELYYAKVEDILSTHSVPFDATSGTKEFDIGGNNSGLGGKTHRFKTLGHDPILGWVFGTANIMTNTLTNDRLLSYHIRKMKPIANAETFIMMDKFLKRSHEDHLALGVCLAKEALHLASDMYSKMGIPLPGIEKWLGPDKARELAEYGIDTGNAIKVGAQASMASLINTIIAKVHLLTRDEAKDPDVKLYEVRTRRIISISNCIATSSNVIAVAIGSIAGIATDNPAQVKESLNYLDIGGIIVTIQRLITDRRFIFDIKKEFIENKYYERINVELEDRVNG